MIGTNIPASFRSLRVALISAISLGSVLIVVYRLGQKVGQFQRLPLSFPIKTVFNPEARKWMVVVTSPKYVQLNHLFWEWGDDHWLDRSMDSMDLRLVLRYDSTYYLDPICPLLKGTLWWHSSLSTNLSLDHGSHVLRVFASTLFPKLSK